MKKRFANLLTLSLFLWGIIACDDFEDLNKNPNEPTNVSTSVLLTSAMRLSVDTANKAAFLLSNNIAQLTARTLRREVDQYNWNAFPVVWEGFYESLTSVESVISQSIEQGNDKQAGVGHVLRVWIFSQLTNAYGDIPYSQAIKGGESAFTPVYDRQEDIYADLLNKLDTAVNLLEGSGTIEGDIIYQGNANHWMRFAHSLHLRLLMYASEKQNVSQDFNRIVQTGLIIGSIEQQAVLDYPDVFPNQFYSLPLKQGDFDDVNLSQSSLNVLNRYKDPRLNRYARPDNLDFDHPSFSGYPNGLGGQSGSRLGLPYFDYPGHVTATQFGLPYADGILMTYSEVEFLIAEGILNGWVQGDLAEHYKKGIEASHQYYQVDYGPFGWSDFDDFYENSGVQYKQPMDLWEQKWLSLYFTALDPYYELRRWYVASGGWEGVSFIGPPQGNNSNNFQLPFRFLYPGQEQSLNQENYNDAISRYKASNLINGKMWIINTP
ncbi:MAG: SusD/RagB family nutrient-binding outer membrane lipoprotein [Flavobacteriaceae bacterium]|nr:SusD/RagB family nutrient-binding outer membrane lipoprotein [Flavobacteriaceae bacterium]